MSIIGYLLRICKKAIKVPVEYKVSIGADCTNLSIISNIEIKYPQQKIKSNCKLILKKFNPKSASDLGRFTELVTLLYIREAYEDAIQVCDLLNDISFHGNYTTWDNVENSRLVKVRILRRNGDEDGVIEVLNTIIPFENKNIWAQQIQCLKTYDTNIIEARKRNSKKDIISWQLIKLEMLIRFMELPGFPVDKARLDNEIEELSKTLRSNII